MRLAYGNYGMPDTPAVEMVRQVAGIGYDGLELCVAPGYPTAPDTLDQSARQELKQALSDSGLDIISILAAKVTVFEADDEQHRANLDYLWSVLELRDELGADVEVSSTLGGRIDDWPDRREALASRVADWATVAGEAGAIFAFEPHVGGIINSPDRALWLLQAVDSPSLRVNFDYSHFELLDIPLAQAVEQLIPFATGVHVKDVAGRAPDFRFLMPGEGTLDYAHYLQLLQSFGYDGCITIEISGQVFGAPGYDALAAAQSSYDALAAAFEKAGIARS